MWELGRRFVQRRLDQPSFNWARTAALAVLLAIGLIVSGPAASASETATLDIELNSLDKSQSGCRVNLVMRNGLESAIDALSLEIVLFKDDGRIASILNLKLGDLPLGKTRVKQFRLDSCDSLSRILINEVSECNGTNLTSEFCLQKLSIKNKIELQFGL